MSNTQNQSGEAAAMAGPGLSRGKVGEGDALPQSRTCPASGGKVGKGTAPSQSATCCASRFDIPVGGPEDAIKREELEELWGMNDRMVRKTIERFRETDSGDPYPILSTSHGAGYWRSNDVQEMERFAAEMAAKARGHFGALKEVRRAIKRENTKGQMTIDGLMAGGTGV